MKIIAPVVLVGFLLLSATVSAGSSTKYWYFDCYVSTGSYTAQSRYGENLKLLFASLPKKVSSSAALFARDAVGSSANETAYAVAQCRFDADVSACHRCVTEALEDAQAVCPFKKSAVVYHDLCMVRFSNSALSWISDAHNFQNTIAVKVDSSDITKQKLQTTQLEMGVNALYTEVTKMAANSSHNFATASEKIDAYGTSYEGYALAQCVGEMTHAECGMCLEDLGITYSLAGLMVHRKATTWCSYRFELYNFFTGSPMVRLPPYRAHKGHKIKKKIILILVVVGVLVLFLALLTIFFFWRKQKKGSVAGEVRNKRIETVEAGFSEKHCQDRTSEEDILSAENAVKCPSAIMCFSDITAMAHGKTILIFLDYDGTVSPIKRNPFEATMPSEIREAVQKAAELFPTSIVSGRLITKLKNFVKLDNLHYAGSHGQEIVMSGELEPSYTPVGNYEETVTAATHYLVEGSREIEGATVENNKYAVLGALPECGREGIL